jgi:uncharacterized membrane protein YccC
VTWIVFPSSERERLPDALVAAIDALAAYARAALDELATGRPLDAPSLSEHRRRTGLAIGHAETSLERFLAEPLRDEGFAADVVLFLTYARRLGTALTSLATLATTGPRAEVAAPDEALADAARGAGGYVLEVLDGARAWARDGSRAAAAPGAPDMSLDAASPVGAALDRIERWAALVAVVAWRPRAVDG